MHFAAISSSGGRRMAHFVWSQNVVPTTGHAWSAELAKGCVVKYCVSKAWNTLHDFCPDFLLIYSLEKMTLVAESQSQSADLSWHRFHRKSHSVWWSQTHFLASDFDSIQSEDIKYVWYFQPILENINCVSFWRLRPPEVTFEGCIHHKGCFI